MAHKIVILDTSVFIDQLRTNKFKEHILGLHGLIRNSSVVLSELLRGATLKEERDFIDTLIKNHPILTPTEKNWIESVPSYQGYIKTRATRLQNSATCISTCL